MDSFYLLNSVENKGITEYSNSRTATAKTTLNLYIASTNVSIIFRQGTFK